MNKVCFILRGLPGSGKSSLAELLRDSVDEAMFPLPDILSADNYFVDKDGNYNFDISRIGEAHDWCYQQFVASISDYKAFYSGFVIVDNTNCKESEFLRYKEYAEEHGYTVFVLLVENWHGNKSVHNVPETTLARREALLRNSIKLR